ncbi:beta-glucuronidase [Pelagicoccus albus]|uniref:Beta-glucuronidase n=1 Tax=Pelagicoccus albus TaxID=415222 RepID=A0A7X1B7H6_9BACT|nr:beta-glucuronidase [Pelagicoccus albus]MBC2607077.1 beta-glucuronidase [Pelagicoccus albus]
MDPEPKAISTPSTGDCLYPQANRFRDVRDLGGMWRLKIDWDDQGLSEAWHSQPLSGEILHAPVPAAYNDLFADAKIRDHVGAVYYETELQIPATWKSQSIHLRFDAAAHHATVWLDGKELGKHKGGFLPFAIDLGAHVSAGRAYRLTVRCDNRLDWTCLPAGEHWEEPHPSDPSRTRRRQEIHFDFINDTGLTRPVRLLALPERRITSVSICPRRKSVSLWTVEYSINSNSDPCVTSVRILDPDEKEVIPIESGRNFLALESPRLWKPGDGQVYTLEVALQDELGSTLDTYRQTFGFRTVETLSDSFLINGQEFYFRGFGKHEESATRGRCLDLPMLTKDFSLLKWIGANSIRTSHYPYSEEFMQMADRAGLVVIDEAPAVGFNQFDGTPVYHPDKANEKTLAHHLDVMGDLLARDSHHPSVVMWSVANEAATEQEAARPYFKSVIEGTRQLDPSRPITIVEDRAPSQSLVADMVDVVSINRYFGWYQYCADLDLAEVKLEEDMREWHERFDKPVIMAEYGADTIHGFHSVTEDLFTEEFQIATVSRYHAVFDRLPHVIGEHIWNFADFATKPGIKRIWGNRKGVFTRERHPKSVAHVLRERWSQTPQKIDAHNK